MISVCVHTGDLVHVYMFMHSLASLSLPFRNNIGNTCRETGRLNEIAKVLAGSSVSFSGLSTTVFPQASAGAIFHASIMKG